MSEQRSPLSRAKLSWLESQSADWVSGGLIDEGSRSRILASYAVEAAGRRGLLALMLLGALMFGIGALLLIGYNWQRLPVAGKIAIAAGSVALAFIGSAFMYAREHRLSGETLAFTGVILYGNAIWLIAHALEMRGDPAEAFMWWAIGAIACAWIVRSRAIGVGAGALVLVWALAAGFTADRPMLIFFCAWAATVAVAYSLESPLMLAPTALSAIAWLCWPPDGTQPQPVSVGAAAIMACACYAVGASHRSSDRKGRAWQVTALATLVGAFVPLLLTGFHTSAYHRPVTWASLVIIVPPALVAASLALRRRRSGAGHANRVADMAMLSMAATVVVWLGFLAAGIAPNQTWTHAATLAFSLMALALSVSFIYKALASDSAPDLTFGVLFALVFLLVRWASLIDSMLWSGLMLLAASAGFFAVARLWGGRTRPSLINV